ncbi:MAG: hypothetical protein HOH83_10090 [Deltaproteobacteria bacterium]|jgi:pullulanase/glycogen debranching enzyme|nr:hypothetical protein [Deltaproteobacteria bacterium]
MDEEDFRLSVISRPKSKVFHGMCRLPVLRQETPTEELIASRPHHPHHPLEQSVIYECHVRGMANSPINLSFWIFTIRDISGTC